MKLFTIFFVLLSTYCYCEPLLGGWKTSDEESDKQEWLKIALVNIRGNEVLDQVQSDVSDLVCETQIVNGLNIKCSFSLSGEKYQCSYYKSFIQPFDTQVEKCDTVKDQQAQEENKNDLSSEEHNDEEDIEDLPRSNNEEKPATLNDNENEEKPSALVDDEEDDEAKIDAVYNKFSENDGINEDEEDDEE
ncbi:unnamed protein product [Rotaria sp. Silwood2]|nr:unnamed protein product [Rotaria sp. Silwood2]CAF2536001.1 unnamed protein product [Rotaria sp. Silwood2]CAF2788238.1 unnamed protein product [Rotaria sp. Silwood2]CAF2941471.1 unnamed protein product [Rotaria sp. Silwood2]CAF4069382.1 unnamed protein product [Rotaria sp. Silwood2]